MLKIENLHATVGDTPILRGLDLVVGRAVVTVWPFDRMTTLSDHSEAFSEVPDAGSNRSLGPPAREPHTS